MFLLASLQTLTNTKIVPHPIYVPAILPSHCLIFSSVHSCLVFGTIFRITRGFCNNFRVTVSYRKPEQASRRGFLEEIHISK
jgi:hypothetical protein